MLRYISIRLLYMVPVIWLVVSVVFLLIHLVPGDPIQQMLGEGAASADVEAARHAYGLDVPLPQQYVNYWKGVLRGDLGRSLRFDQPVTRRDPATLSQDTAVDAGFHDCCLADLHPGRSSLGAPPQSLG